MSRQLATIILLFLICLAGISVADDLDYVSNEELEGEIDRRKADIERTQSRIVALADEHRQALVELNDAKDKAAKAEEMVAVRARALYRFTQLGRTLKYPMGSGSPIRALKRFNQLKYLVQDGIADRQRAVSRLENAKANVKRIEYEQSQAEDFLKMLKETLAELHNSLTSRNSN